MSAELRKLSRAEYRRRLRVLGKHRADGKRGRRGAVRAMATEDSFPTLAERGFVVGQRRLILPGDEG